MDEMMNEVETMEVENEIVEIPEEELEDEASVLGNRIAGAVIVGLTLYGAKKAVENGIVLARKGKAAFTNWCAERAAKKQQTQT